MVRRALGGSVVAGVAMATAFPPFDAPWWILPIALAVVLHNVRSLSLRAAALHGLLFAFAFHLVLLRWMVVVGLDAWLALALLEALFFIPVTMVRAHFGTSAWAVPAVAFMLPLTDALRDHAGVVAFGWGQLAFASVDAPWARLAPFTNQWAITGVVAAMAAALTVSAGLPVRLAAWGAVVLAATVPFLSHPVAHAVGKEPRIAIVQAGVSRTGLGFSGDPRDALRRLAALTVREIPRADVVAILWPENAVDVDPYRDATSAEILRSTAKRIARPIVFGAVLGDSRGRYNAALIVEPSGSIRTLYVKQRLVPFGEFLPARDFLESFIKRTQLIPVDFLPGTGSGSVAIDGRSLGIVICFEVADEGVVRNALSSGENGLLVQTNNATYVGLGQSEQQLRIAQFRALSLGVPVYVSSTTGPSAVIDSTGRIVQRIDEGDTGILVVGIPDAKVTP